MTQASHLHDAQLGGTDPPPLRIRIAPLSEDDMRYAHLSWQESYKESSTALMRSPWPMYKATVGKQLGDVLSAAKIVGAFTDAGRIGGWLAYTPGRAVDTVHWMYTRFKVDGIHARRRGVQAALVDHAGLSHRICYTHRGAREVMRRGRKWRSADAAIVHCRGPTSDVAMADWLRAGGRSVVFVPYEEWSR